MSSAHSVSILRHPHAIGIGLIKMIAAEPTENSAPQIVRTNSAIHCTSQYRCTHENFSPTFWHRRPWSVTPWPLGLDARMQAKPLLTGIRFHWTICKITPTTGTGEGAFPRVGIMYNRLLAVVKISFIFHDRPPSIHYCIITKTHPARLSI